MGQSFRVQVSALPSIPLILKEQSHETRAGFFSCIKFSCVPDNRVLLTYIFQNIPGDFGGDGELLKSLKIPMVEFLQTTKIPYDENIKLDLCQESHQLIHEKTGLKNPVTVVPFYIPPNFVLSFWRINFFI